MFTPLWRYLILANKPKKNLGKPCVLNTECKSSNCVDGKCARLTEKLFRKQLSISPTFLQSALKQGVNKPGDYIVELDKNDGYPDKLFQDSDSAMGEGKPVRPTHKLRITSKKSRRRFDINVIFSYKKVTDYKEIPEGAELIYEARAKTNNQWELINKPPQ